MIATRGVMSARDGRIADLEDVARRLMAECTDQDGLLVYQFCRGSDPDHLVVVEAYRDSEAWLHHMASTDFTEINTLAVIEEIEIYGEHPNSELARVLESIGAHHHFPAL